MKVHQQEEMLTSLYHFQHSLSVHVCLYTCVQNMYMYNYVCVFAHTVSFTEHSLPTSVTVLQVLKSICQKRQLDPSSYAVALPPDSAHGQPVLCQHSMSVGGLRSNEIHIVKRPSKQAPTEGADSATSNGVNEHVSLCINHEIVT